MDELIRNESDANQKLKLRRFLRGLRSASDDVAQTARLFCKFDDADSLEYESIVAGNASALNAEFYEYLQNIIMAEHDNKARQEELLKLGAQVSALQEAFAKIEADASVMQNAAEKFHSLLEVRFSRVSLSPLRIHGFHLGREIVLQLLPRLATEPSGGLL